MGQALAGSLLAAGNEVVVLSRSGSSPGLRGTPVRWDGATLGDWAETLNDSLAVVNLAGKPVYCRHTAANCREIVRSRIDSVKVLTEAVGRCAKPPPVFIQVSGTHFYGDPGDRVCDESSPRGSGFLADTCVQWEEAFQNNPTPGVRRVLLRLGMVMGNKGGAMPVLARLARWFLGGSVSSGKQYVSWLHVADASRLFQRAISEEKFSGVYNAVSPQPVTNAEFMRQLRQAVHRPWSPPAPAWGVRLGAMLLGFAPELALTGQRCLPQKLLAQGFAFEFPELAGALRELVG